MLFALLLRGLVAARCAPASPSPGAVRDDADGPAALALTVRLYDDDAERTVTLPLEEYVLHVAAGEMPASFAGEAIRAQTVAARTYTVYHMLHGGCRSHDADVCTGSGCCQAYCAEADMQAKWGERYAENRALFAEAAADTAGAVLLYDGEVVEALYHSASGGHTENAEDVYSAALPYLRGVESTAECGTRRLYGEKRFSAEAFVALVNAEWPKARLTVKKLQKQVAIEETLNSGRVKTLRLGNVTVTGRQARGAFSLDSALFTLTVENGEVAFFTRGFGHGVGMSQTGANAMALAGRTWEEIVRYYYTGVTVGLVTTADGE